MATSKSKNTKAISSEEEIANHDDPKIDQDMQGFPHHPSTKEELLKKDPTPKINEKKGGTRQQDGSTGEYH